MADRTLVINELSDFKLVIIIRQIMFFTAVGRFCTGFQLKENYELVIIISDIVHWKFINCLLVEGRL